MSSSKTVSARSVEAPTPPATRVEPGTVLAVSPSRTRGNFSASLTLEKARNRIGIAIFSETAWAPGQSSYGDEAEDLPYGRSYTARDLERHPWFFTQPRGD